MKKKLLVVFVLMIGLITFQLTINANETENFSSSFSYQETNPMYPSTTSVNNKKKMMTSKKAEVKNTIDLSDYIENKTKIAENIRDNAVARNTVFTIYTKVKQSKRMTQSDFNNYISELLQTTMSEELANNSSAGDYLKWSWKRYEVNSAYAQREEKTNYVYYFNLTFYFDYYTTYEQERVLDQSVQSYIHHAIDRTKDSDYDKVKKIHDFICTNITYDYTNLNNSNYFLKYTAYAAMQNKTGVCQGYAALYYKMLKESGFSNIRIITSSTHAWNIVRLGPMYYHVDTTWDSENKNYPYFLRGDNYFNSLKEHTKNKELTTISFRSKYPIHSKDYNKENITISLKNCKLSNLSKNYTYTGKAIVPNVCVTYEDYTLVKGKDYNLTLKNNKKIGVATLEIKGIGYFKDKITNQKFTIIPPKVTIYQPKKGVKKLIVKWKKVNIATGYMIEYSTNKNFKANKTKKVTIKSKKTVSKTIRRLKKRQKYYIRIKSYSKVKGKTYYSKYSKVKNQKTK